MGNVAIFQATGNGDATARRRAPVPHMHLIADPIYRSRDHRRTWRARSRREQPQFLFGSRSRPSRMVNAPRFVTGVSHG